LDEDPLYVLDLLFIVDLSRICEVDLQIAIGVFRVIKQMVTFIYLDRVERNFIAVGFLWRIVTSYK
jgi:hypothetical protein